MVKRKRKMSHIKIQNKKKMMVRCDISYEEVDEKDLISLKENDETYNFDINSLIRIGNYKNPFTTNDLPDNIINKMKERLFNDLKVVNVKFMSYTTVKYKDLFINKYADIGDIIIEIYRSFDMLQHFGKFEIYFENMKNEVLDFSKRIRIDTIVIIVIFKEYDYFENPNYEVRCHKLWKYSLKKNIPWISDIIDNKYQIDNIKDNDKPSTYDFHRIIDEFENESNHDKILEFLKSNYKKFKISYDQCLEIKRRFYNKKLDTHFEYIYSFIVDKYKISKNDNFKKYIIPYMSNNTNKYYDIV